MRLNIKAYLLGLPVMCVSSWAAALGLGEIKLNSTLNQPLSAEIELINVRDLTTQEIIVRLAPKADFDRAGVDLTYFLTDLKYSVDLSVSNRPVVRVTTIEPVKEPFLNFILVAMWPSGKLLREYTLLVDLPVFSGTKAKPVQVASKSPKPINQQSSNQRASNVTGPNNDSTVNESASENPKSTYNSDVYGPVSSKDTLWSIASKVRPDSSYSIQQTMLAIQRLNPNAFINNNINLLRRGQVLRVPDAQQIGELTTSEAVREVAGQNSSWSSNASEDDSGAQLEGSKNFAETKTDVEEVEGRVKLSSNTTSDSEATQGADDSVSGGAQIEKSLDQSQEELDAVDREKLDLESRLSAIDEQIETMEKLVEVSNDELRALELAAQQSNNDTNSEVSEVATPDVEPEVVAVDSSESTESVQEVAKPVQPVQPVQQPEKSIVDLIMENITYIVAGVGGLVLLVGGFLFIRNRSEEFDPDFDDELDELASFDVETLDNDMSNFDESAVDDTEAETQFIEDDSTNLSVSADDTPAEAETEDVVGECDIHLAYGQYDQAEEKLLKALEKEPANALVRLKLMEVLAAQGDAEGFDANYAKILVLNDGEISSRAASLREGVINIPTYDASKYDTSEFEALIGLTSSDSASHVSEDVLDFSETELSQNAELNSEISSDDADFEDDTLIAALDSNEDNLESDLDSNVDDLEFNLELDDDSTVVNVAPESELDLDDDSLDLDSLTLDEPGSEDELSIDSELGDFDLGDLELDLDGSDLSVSEVDDELDDLEFDLEGSLDSDDEEFSADFTENLVADSAVVPASEDSMDFSSLELDLDDSEGSDELDLELDEDSLDLSDIDGDEEPLHELSLEVESEVEESLDLSDDSLDLAGDENLELGSLEENTTGSVDEGDFDVTFNLEDNLDLDELDSELDELAAESLDDESLDLTSLDSDSVSDELEDTTDLADASLDMDLAELTSQPELAELSETEVGSYHGISDSVGSLSDLDAEAANEIDLDTDTTADSSVASEFDADFEIPDFDPENDDDSNLDFLSDNDETATKLDLARAYIDMGDADGAKDILDEILEEGNDGQKKDAEGLLKKLA